MTGLQLAFPVRDPRDEPSEAEAAGIDAVIAAQDEQRAAGASSSRTCRCDRSIFVEAWGRVSCVKCGREPAKR